MVVLGIVVIVLAVLLGVAVVVSNPVIYDLHLFGAQLPVTMAGVFFTGAGAMLATLLGLLLIQRGIVRARRRSKARKLAARPTAPAAPIQGREPSRSTTGPAATSAPRSAAGSAASAGSTGPAPANVVGTQPASTPRADGPASTAEERAALLAEAEQATRDEPR
jgi:hypothetical protein